MRELIKNDASLGGFVIKFHMLILVSQMEHGMFVQWLSQPRELMLQHVQFGSFHDRQRVSMQEFVHDDAGRHRVAIRRVNREIREKRAGDRQAEARQRG